MRLIVLAVFLAIMQAAPPVPRKASDNAAGAPQTRQDKSASDNAPSQTPTPAVHLTASNGGKEKGDDEGSKNTGNTVRITEMPPVAVAPNKRDWVDWGYWGFNGLLVIVGGCQVWLLFRTLGAIKRQADIYDEQRKIMEGQLGTMQGQLDAMKAAGEQASRQIAIAEDNIKIIISKERALLRLEALDLRLPDATTPVASVEYRVRLYGPTEAIIDATISDAIVTDSEEPLLDETPMSDLFLPKIISPSDSPLTRYQLVTTSERIHEDIEAIYKGKKFVHFWGSILYSDRFGRLGYHYYTKFRFVWRWIPGVTRGGKPHGRWTQCGPTDENRAI